MSFSIKSIFILFIPFIQPLLSHAQGFLQVPIQGTQGNEWVIVNYVDWELNGFKDHQCGSKSYDGHQGTDFVIRSFKAMDDSVAVYAAADGIVTFVVDSLFDRETGGDTAKHLGNYIALSHANDYQTYYAHLMKNSAQVAVGTNVQMGDVIGYVGSSGNSTDPHLHFELWFDSTFVVDPFSGICGNSNTSFISPPAYDSSLTVWESGLHLKNNLTINELRERIITISTPYVIAASSDADLNFWTHLYGVRKDKELKIQWYTPNNVVWYEYSFLLNYDYWYYYYWSFIDHQNLENGAWTVKLLYDGTEIVAETFVVNDQLSIDQEVAVTNICDNIKNLSIDKIMADYEQYIQVFNLNGQAIKIPNASDLPSGFYVFKIMMDDEYCSFKRKVD